MYEDKYYIKISPEVINGDIFQVCYPSGVTYDSGCTFVYSSMTSILSGGTNGDSLLTGLTIPILLTESAVDVGYYSVFDGALSQADVVKNFIFSATTSIPMRYFFYNTSEKEYKNYLELSTFTVNWGDNSPIQTVTTYSPNYIYHDYLNNGEYTITLTQTNPWGVNTVKKVVEVPFTGLTISNPLGTAYFTPNIGSWSGTAISYDYIFFGDAINDVLYQDSSNYVSVPFPITGNTKSRITELGSYGPNKYQVNHPVYDKNNQLFGVITSINSSFTAYTIENVDYFDLSGGTTIYALGSSGLTVNWLLNDPIVKDESLINVMFQPEVQSDVYIERGKNSALERIQRLGEVNNIGDLELYGYGFFNFRDAQKI